jgi:GMP synthase-like glutamine amidotransferase
MKILLIDNGTKHLRKLKDLLKDFEVDIYPLFDKYPSFYGYNLIILSGGSNYAVKTNPDKFEREINLIKDAKIPIIGICQGCEIIAYTFNSDLEKINPKTKGVRNIEFIDKDFFRSKMVEVYEAHRWVIKRLGKKLTGIAKSQTGFEVIKHKPIYGLQFHPEMFVDKTLGDDIFMSIIAKTKNGN